MMSDIEIIYELLLSEDYKDKLLLEITIDKIKETLIHLTGISLTPDPIKMYSPKKINREYE